MSVNNNSGNYARLRRTRPKLVTISARKERNLSIKKVSVILQKDESLRTKEENELLFNYSEIVKEAARRIERRRQLKERLKEIEDSEAVLDAKCKQLAEAIQKAEYLVAYTGAGISTAARIPDYRGTSGIWTLLQQGKDIGTHDLTQADPTYTHMALFQLYSQGKLKHIVSQNCDGLHLRSGLPKRALSEVHGNMYIEVCRTCRPIIEYLRLFDVTENTGRYSHKTMRKCYKCNSSLVDSIVHFGERGNLPWPLNWKGACKAAEKADMILCIGSSLKVLKRYPWLWCMDKPAKLRPDIYIVNLQWTPKDCYAAIKINGKCDAVMEKLMKYLSITVPKYSRKLDPIFEHATELCKEEKHTKNRPFLTLSKKGSPDMDVKTEPCNINSNDDLDNKKLNCEIFDKVKSEYEESCVTTCKKEIVIDTGQEDMKCIKEELILITIRSGSNFKDCCNLFKIDQSHDIGCPNFIDEKNDIPVIIEDDLMILKSEAGSPLKKGLVDCLSVKSGELTSGSSEINTVDDTSALLSEQNFAQITYLSEKEKMDFASHKRLNGSEGSENGNKKAKFSDGNNENVKTKIELNSYSKSVLEPEADGETIKNGSTRNGNYTKKKISDSVKCSYCSKQYLSNTCLFYLKRQPGFKGKVSTCDCCSSEGEDDGNEISDEKISESQIKANPGWYGKGIRKNIRKKR